MTSLSKWLKEHILIKCPARKWPNCPHWDIKDLNKILIKTKLRIKLREITQLTKKQ